MASMNILAAVDRFPQDEAVLKRALEFAKLQGAALTIVHVVDLPRHVTLPAKIDTLEGQAEFAARDRIEVALRQNGTDPAGIEIIIETGSPALRLIEVCDKIRPDLVVMRAHQRTSIGEKILGSTTDRIIAAGKQPVLVVKRSVRDAYCRVLVATNGTDDAQKALYIVGTLLPDAALHLVQVVHIVPQLEEAMLRGGTDQSGFRAHRNVLARIARNRLTAIASVAAGQVKTHVLRGEPAAALVRASSIANVDLIVAGPGRSSLIRRAFVGSVTRRLLRDAACEVLICRSTE